MKIRLRRDGQHAHMVVQGEFDLFLREPFLEQVQALTHDGVVSVSLDMRRVGFLGSTGVTALLRARRLLGGLGGTLIIETASRHVREAIAQLGLAEQLFGDRRLAG